MNLADLQNYFAALITAPTGPDEGLAQLRLKNPATPGFAETFRETPRLPANERIAIYANMYFFRLLEAIAHEFPKCAAVLGEARFHNLITDYLLVHPSHHPDIARIANPLPDYLAANPLAEFPFLADLARLEMARSEAFIAANALPLTLAAVQTRPPESLGELALHAAPSLRIITVHYSVHELWSALEADAHDHGAASAVRCADKALSGDAAEAAMVPRAVAIRVWRKNLRAFHQEITPLQAQLLRMTQAGCRFADWCETLAASGEADPAARAAELLVDALNEEVLAG